MSYHLNSLSELGLKWKTGLKAAINWLAKNDSLTVGFEATTYDTGMLNSANCSKLAEVGNVLMVSPTRELRKGLMNFCSWPKGVGEGVNSDEFL